MDLKSENDLHGGRVYEAARRWGVDPKEIVDFSANINPFGPPRGVYIEVANSLDSIHSYPDISELVDSIARKLDVDRNCITIGNGSTALVFAAARTLKPEKPLIFEPAFAEYRRALHSISANVKTMRLSARSGFQPDWDDLVRARWSRFYDSVIINNPHNPSGELVKAEGLIGFASELKQSGISLIIDEAFIDYVPEASTLPRILEFDNTIVLRSLTKFYSMPGLRVGYAVSHPKLAARIQEQIEEWPVSSLAIRAAIKALSDPEFDDLTRKQNQANRSEFINALNKLPGVLAYASSANFVLVRLRNRDCARLAEWLEPHRILIRLCNSFEGLGPEYMRLAVLNRSNNLRLIKLIEEWLLLGSA
ncbi:MAG TPA: threonine-phosphate decarboxylase CobD [Blastocatellia bacterium]|nr:threonine-phosphate decarboxylase CobD [Blastocatellia bacterium]